MKPYPKHLPQEMRIKLIIFLIIPAFFLSCAKDIPVISSIDPKIGRMGEFITLTGSNFGEARDESYVTIAGISPTNSSYSVWQDDLIIVRVPELGESGLVYVHSRGKKSNGVLFSNTISIPRPVEGEELGLEPRIISITPQSGAPGTVISIKGSNFGMSRESSLNTLSGAFFSWDYDSGTFNPYIVREPEFIEASETEMGYESWNSREIRIRIPDGAVSGNFEIITPHGKSRPVYFDVTGKPGNKNFKDKRIYTINYSVDIKVLEATRPNTLYLWIPKPIISSSQRNMRLVSRNTEPFVENYRGTSLYKLDNIGTGVNQSINLSFRVEIYSVETDIRAQSIATQEKTPLFAMYTQSTPLIPSDSDLIKTTAASITGREQNPYLKARLIYNWIIANMRITNYMSANTLNASLEQRQANPYTAALLFSALTRAAGVPCIPVAGVLINENWQTTNHYWAEFWINGFGWIPVDPAMGAGIMIITGNSPEGETERNPENFYFGNLDNQRIAFSRGDISLSQMESRGRIVSHSQSYSLQNIWEEAAGGIESYSSLWENITISGVYTH